MLGTFVKKSKTEVRLQLHEESIPIEHIDSYIFVRFLETRIILPLKLQSISDYRL